MYSLSLYISVTKDKKLKILTSYTAQDFSSSDLLKHFTDEIWQTDILRKGTMYGKLYKAKVSFIAYPFFVPRQTFRLYGLVPVLDLRDIAVMKIVAISQRGRKRDFFYLY